MTDKQMLKAIFDKMGEMSDRLTGIETDVSELKTDVKFNRERIILIENDHGQKLGALLDGYKLNSEKLDRIEKEVTRHEEIILRKIQ